MNLSFTLLSDLEKTAIALNINNVIVDGITRKTNDRFESHEDANLILLDILVNKEENNQCFKINIYHSLSDLVFIGDSEYALKTIKDYMPPEIDNLPSTSKLLEMFFETLIKDDLQFLDNIEIQIMNMEDEILVKDTKLNISEIVEIRRGLLALKKYYEQFDSVLNGLLENENSIIERKEVRRFKILNSKIDRLANNVVHLRDYATQMREAHQAQVDIKMNEIMKTFTVITSIFLPLTLIVGWYGMNLKMPEYSLPFAYPLVIAFAIVVVIAFMVYFKKKNWF